MEILIFAVILGLIPAAIASKKGGSFMLWWLCGAMLFIVALPMAIIMKPQDKLSVTGLRKCPECAEYVQAEAKICKHCKSELTPLTNSEKKQLTKKAKKENHVPGWLVLLAFGCVGFFIWFMASGPGR